MVYGVQMLLKPEWFVVCLNATEACVAYDTSQFC